MPKKRVAIMGSDSMAVWLCRALHGRAFSIRLFERDRRRAQALAEKLDWVTVIQADPTERSVFDEENLAQADLFVSLLGNDEANIVAGVLAKARGVAEVMTVVQQSKYLDIVYDIGIDRAFSTRHVAGEDIDRLLDERPLRHLGSLAEGSVDVFRVRVEADAVSVGKPLREIHLSPDWVVAAIQRNRDVRVPGAEDVIDKGDVVLVVGRHGREEKLRKLLTG
jgi:trk system potassium uptake protein TrkA